MEINKNLQIILDKIHSAEIKAGRIPGSVKLMAVSKFHPVEKIVDAIKGNQLLFGENRVKEACEKFEKIYSEYPEAQLHIIGQVQTNKVRNAVKISSCIQSVDRLELLEEIEKQCVKLNKSIDVLLEYHTAEDSKSGFTSENDIQKALQLFEENHFPHITVKGFMTMAPFTEDKKLVRSSFVQLRTLKEKMQAQFPGLDLNDLSMGMSGDFEIAIEEGSTLVRVGTAIFGEREY